MSIPKSWTETKIGAVADINPALPRRPMSSENVSFLGMADVGVGEILDRKMRAAKHVASGFTQFAEADVLVAKITPCFENGKGCLCNDLENGIGYGSTEFIVIRAKPEADPAFLFFHTVTEKFRSVGTASMVGSAGQKRVQASFVRSYSIPLPPLPEQKEIARILLLWDAAIRDTTQLIAAKTRLKRALMQQLLTGKLRFREFVKSDEEQMTKHGLRPVDWPDLHIHQFAHEVSERMGSGDKLPVLSCTKHAGLVDSLKYFGKRIFSEDIANYKIVRRNQFAYATNHIEEGSIGLLTEIEAGVVSPMYTVFAVKDNACPSFLFMLFKTEMYRHIFSSNTSASVDRRGSLRWRLFSLIRVALPSKPEQEKIALTMRLLEQEIELLQSQLAALKQQKRGLMQKLLTGAVRVEVPSDA